MYAPMYTWRRTRRFHGQVSRVGREEHPQEKERTHLPHRVRVLARLDAGGVDRAVGLVPDVEHHHGAVVTAHRQQGVVHRVEVEAHNL